MKRLIAGKSYTPEELRLPFPEIKKINIEYCPDNFSFWSNLAHAHVFLTRAQHDKFKTMFPFNFSSKEVPYNKANYEKVRDQVCFSSKEFVYATDGSPSETSWHEYAHILNDKAPEDNFVHGPKWNRVFKYLLGLRGEVVTRESAKFLFTGSSPVGASNFKSVQTVNLVEFLKNAYAG